jgi:polyhydroxyalkanoate synthesis repressor PhaR
MQPEFVSIKRYPNRRFYDRQARKYVTLQGIEEMVREGATVEVRDSKTGENLTRLVLTQILLERHPEKMDLFPIALIHSMFRANDLALEFLRGSLRQSVTLLESLQKPNHSLGSFLLPLDWMKAFLPGPTPAAAAGGAGVSMASSDVESLTSQISELERRLGRLESETDAAPGEANGGASPDRLERPLEKQPPRRPGAQASPGALPAAQPPRPPDNEDQNATSSPFG